ncbi:MAG: prepilin-type N-terminal cleavage/methylation domain-containing protein [Phycisphaerae bacterium]
MRGARNGTAGVAGPVLPPEGRQADSQFSIPPRRAGAQFYRSAFSLAELMIALVILGIGLITVASMFPIAWTKARDLADFTTQAAITDAAQTMLANVARVSNPAGQPTSFQGDPTALFPDPDPFVHPLHMQNLTMDRTANWIAAGTLVPTVGDFEDPAAATVPNADFDLNLPPSGLGPGLRLTPLPTVQSTLYERVYPPLPPPPVLAGPALDRWWTLLNQRRYCWSALHRLDTGFPLGGGTPSTTTGDMRSFDVYLVTLRRGQATHRYARQDPTNPARIAPNRVAVPNPVLVDPLALGPENDVAFPVPWRVQIQIDQPTVDLGVPGAANIAPATAGEALTAQMILRGSYLIDELNGNIYHVAKRQLDPANVDQASLTFDASINSNSLRPIPSASPEFLRTVWVYPPPVDRAADGSVAGFIGPQPVVGIDVRTMVFAP